MKNFKLFSSWARSVIQHFQRVRRMRLGARTSFPLPSTGRGIEGEGWERSERRVMDRVASKKSLLFFCPFSLLPKPPLPMNRTRKLLEMNKTIELGSRAQGAIKVR